MDALGKSGERSRSWSCRSRLRLPSAPACISCQSGENLEARLPIINRFASYEFICKVRETTVFGRRKITMCGKVSNLSMLMRNLQLEGGNRVELVIYLKNFVQEN